jgi:hypothetical protein
MRDTRDPDSFFSFFKKADDLNVAIVLNSDTTRYWSGIVKVYAAWCNANYLVVFADGTSSFKGNMDNTPRPPSSTETDGSTCRTREGTRCASAAQAAVFPLSITLLSTAAATNNENTAAFPGGAADSTEGYIAGPPTYGLPVRSGIGITTDGQSIFPTFNNLGRYTTNNIEGTRAEMEASVFRHNGY